MFKYNTLITPIPVTRKSYGIILFKKTYNNNLEVLVVQRRFTYAFYDFTHGKYYLDDVSVRELLTKMTAIELLEIYTLDYDKLWTRIWIDRKIESGDYEKGFNKFNILINKDNGAKLKNMINNIVPDGELLWEIPKGRKNKKEPDIFTAIREFEEETGYKKYDYTILPNITKKVTYKSDGQTYEYKYFLALLRDDEEKSPTKFEVLRHCEIGAVKWVSLQESKYLNKKQFLPNIIGSTKKIIKKYLKGKYKINFINDD